MPEKVRNSWKITVIERRSHWTGGWAHQYVMTDRHSLEELSPSYDDCRYGAHFVRDEILEVRLDTRQVVCRDKGVITADYLLLALGMQAQATPLVENKLWNICNPEHATKLKEAIEQIKPGDSVLVCITRVPYQCPPAPQEFAFLIDDVLRRRGIRDQVRLAISLPMPNVVPVENPTRVREILKQKSIEVFCGCQPESIVVEPDGRRTVHWMAHPKFNPDGKIPLPASFSANLLLGTWPQQTAKVLLPYANEMGFVPADTKTLRTKYENVYAAGDCNWMMLPTNPPKPHPKAGGFAEGQARIAVRNIMSGADWHSPAPYHQDSSCKTACGIETSMSDLILASIDLHTNPAQPVFDVLDCSPTFKKEWVKERMEKHFK